jgi:hypothetical protein
LDWFIKDFISKCTKYIYSGDQAIINAVYKAAGSGSEIVASVNGEAVHLQKLGIEMRQEAVPTVVDETWFNLYFLSLGAESRSIVKTRAVYFILTKLKEMGLSPPELTLKLFYLPPVPAATTTDGHHMITVGGFTNISKKRVEINIFQPKDYSVVFNYLVHEIVHMCLLEKSNIEEAAKVESEVDSYVSIFFDKFGKEWASVKMHILKELKAVIDDTELPVFIAAESHLSTIMDISRSKSIIATFYMFFDAILYGRVKASSMS